MTSKLCPENVQALYKDASAITRLLVAARPAICPMQPLLDAVPAGSHVLDIGCGKGLLLAWLASNNKIESGLGCDVSVIALQEARLMAEAFHKAHGKCVLTFASCSDFLPEGPFDVVSMVDVMHHILPEKQQDIFLEAISRIKAGGVLLYKDMSIRPRWRAWANRAHDLLIARQWIHYLPLNLVKNWAEENGLILHQEKHYTSFVYGHELLVFHKPRISS